MSVIWISDKVVDVRSRLDASNWHKILATCFCLNCDNFWRSLPFCCFESANYLEALSVLVHLSFYKLINDTAKCQFYLLFFLQDMFRHTYVIFGCDEFYNLNLNPFIRRLDELIQYSHTYSDKINELAKILSCL